MATRYAFVTLLTSDSYLPGALTLAAALRDVHPTPAVEPEVDFQTACLVTPETVDVSSIKLLRGAFDVVVGVEIIEDDDRKGLDLLGKSCRFVSEGKGDWAERLESLVSCEVDLCGPPIGRYLRLRLSRCLLRPPIRESSAPVEPSLLPQPN
jgi:hypothetical protein